MSSEFKSIKESLEDALKYYKLEESNERGSIFEIYNELVGDKISKISRVIKIEKGILFVEVDNAAWKNELFMMREIIQEKINNILNKKVIKEIRFN